MNGLASVAGFGLLLVRPGMIVIVTPFFGALNAPAMVRVGVTVLLALVLAPVVQLPGVVGAGTLAIVVAREVLIGLALAFAIRLLMHAAEFAGQFAGYQMGLSLGSLIDPQSGVNNNILALLYANLTVVVCLASNAHHALLRALADSYRSLPVGLGGGLNASLGSSVARMLGLVFTLGVRIAAPILLVLIVVELALGLVGRVAPSLNLLMAGTPIRVVLGLLIIAASLGALPDLVGRFVPAALSIGAEAAGAFR